MGHRKSHHQVNESDGEKRPTIQKQATDRKSSKSVHLSHDASSESYRDADYERKKGHKRERAKQSSGTRKKHRQRHRAFDSHSLCKVKGIQRAHGKAKARKRSDHYVRIQSSDSSDSDFCSSSERSSSYGKSRMKKRSRLQQPDYVHDSNAADKSVIKAITGRKETIVNCGSEDVKEEDQCRTYQSRVKTRSELKNFKSQQRQKDKNSGKVTKSKEILEHNLLIQSSVFARREMEPADADESVSGETTGVENDGSRLDFLERELRQHALANYMKYLDTAGGQKVGLSSSRDEPNEVGEVFELKNDVTDTHIGDSKDILVGAVSDLDSRNMVALANPEVDGPHPISLGAGLHLQETAIEEGCWPQINEPSLQMGSVKTQAAATVDQNAERNEADGYKLRDTGRSQREIKAKFEDDERSINLSRESLNGKGLVRSVNPPQVTNQATLQSVSRLPVSVSVEGNAHAETTSNEIEKVSVEDSSVIAESKQIPIERPSRSQQNDASMFQQKTMSVVRGGEVVQVNYKVYIPQRAAELAKRRLHR